LIFILKDNGKDHEDCLDTLRKNMAFVDDLIIKIEDINVFTPQEQDYIIDALVYYKEMNF